MVRARRWRRCDREKSRQHGWGMRDMCLDSLVNPTKKFTGIQRLGPKERSRIEAEAFGHSPGMRKGRRANSERPHSRKHIIRIPRLERIQYYTACEALLHVPGPTIYAMTPPNYRANPPTPSRCEKHKGGRPKTWNCPQKNEPHSPP